MNALSALAVLGILAAAALASVDAPVPPAPMQGLESWYMPPFYTTQRSAAPYWGNASVVDDLESRVRDAVVAVDCTYIDHVSPYANARAAMDACRMPATVEKEVYDAWALATWALSDPVAGRAKLVEFLDEAEAEHSEVQEELTNLGPLDAADLEIAAAVAASARGFGGPVGSHEIIGYYDAQFHEGGQRDLTTVQWVFFNVMRSAEYVRDVQDFMRAFPWREGPCQIVYPEGRVASLEGAMSIAAAIADAMQQRHPEDRHIADYARRVRDLSRHLEFDREYPLLVALLQWELQYHLNVLLWADYGSFPSVEEADRLLREELEKFGSLTLDYRLYSTLQHMVQPDDWDNARTKSLSMAWLGLDYFPAMECSGELP